MVAPGYGEDENEPEWLTRQGFELDWSDGWSVYAEVKCYERATSPRWLVLANSIHDGQYIYVDDVGDLFALRLKLRREFLSPDEIGMWLSNLSEIAKKTFRSEHGHPISSVCDRCDPETFAAIKKIG